MRNLTDQERVCIAFLRSIGYSRQDVADILSRGTRTVTRTTGELHFTKQERKNTKTIQHVLEKIRTNDTDDLERPMPGQQVFDEFREPEPEDDRLKLVVGEKPREKKHITFAEAYAAYEKAGLCGNPVPQIWRDYMKQWDSGEEMGIPSKVEWIKFRNAYAKVSADDIEKAVADTEKDIIDRATGGRVTNVDFEQGGGVSFTVETPPKNVNGDTDLYENQKTRYIREKAIEDTKKVVDGMYEKRIYDAVEPHTNYLRDLIRGIVREEMGASE